jgi:hypothetical protein
MTTKHITLPSGGWWEFHPRPLWKHLRQWISHDTESDLVERALASLTIAWSFPAQVSPEALSRLDADDRIAMLDAFQRETSPYLESKNPKAVAEALLTSLVRGQVPPEFAEAHVMAATGWTWQALQETPADLVQKMAIYLAVQHARATSASLDFSETEGETP